MNLNVVVPMTEKQIRESNKLRLNDGLCQCGRKIENKEPRMLWGNPITMGNNQNKLHIVVLCLQCFRHLQNTMNTCKLDNKI